MERIGTYRIDRVLGSTTTGMLYEAGHLVLPRRAAIKVAGLLPLAVQVMREACVVDALRHPGVPRIFESGILPDRRPWFAAELIEGVTLLERTLRVDELTKLLRDVASILEHAHRRGVIHGALRPERIVLARDRIVISDWSEARPHDAVSPLAHVPTPGSRHYLAPEVARGDRIDDRADVYAFGVTAYEALTGSLPRDHVNDDAHVPVLDRAPGAPIELAMMIDQMLAPDRFDRPSSAELRADLEFLVDALEPQPLRIRRPRWTPAYTDVRLIPTTPAVAKLAPKA